MRRERGQRKLSTLTRRGGIAVALASVMGVALLAGATVGSAASAKQAASAKRVAELPRESTLYVGRTGGPLVPNGNPLSPAAVTDAGLRQAVFEQLFYFNWMNGKVESWLAKSYKFNKTYTLLTVDLRPGIKWNDGQAFTSADVKFTFDALLKTATLLNAGTVQTSLKSVSTPSASRVVFNLAKPDRRFVGNILAGYISTGVTVVPKHIFQDQDVATFTFWDPARGWPFGTGPYRISAQDTSRATFTRNASWWAAKTKFKKLPAPRYIVYQTVTPDIEAQSLVSNQLDLSSGNINGLGTWHSIRKQNELLGTWSSNGFVDPCPISLELNAKAAPWDDPEMRWALNYAIDKKKFSNLFNQTTPYVTGYVYPDYPRLRGVIEANKAVFAKYPETLYSTQRSNSILTSKGYHKSGNKWVNAQGRPLTINLKIFSPTVAAAWGVARETLTQQLESAGFTVNSQALDFGALATALSTGNFDALTWFECGSISEPWQTLYRWRNDQLAPIGQRNPTPNNSRWNNQQYTNIVNQMALLPGYSPRAKALTTQAMTIFLRELPVIELTQAAKTIIYSAKYWRNWPTIKNAYYQPQPQLYSFHQVLLRLKVAPKG
jgi:peptide/nickel transport system substrate-binding protein